MYLIIGKGPEKENIERSIKKYNLSEKVFILEGVDNDNLKKIYSVSDLFIMPNIHIEDDLEGFGVVLIESASAGVYSVASRIDGIPDAVIEGVTGTLLTSGESECFINEICQKNSYDHNKVMKSAIENFSWEETVKKYLALFLSETKLSI